MTSGELPSASDTHERGSPAPQAAYAFLILLENEKDAVEMTRLLEELRASPPSAEVVFVAPSVRGLAYLDAVDSPELRAWRESRVPSGAQFVYLIDDVAGLAARINELHGLVFVWLKNETRTLAETDLLRLTVGGQLDLAVAVMRHFAEPARGLPQLFDPEMTRGLSQMLGAGKGAADRQIPRPEFEIDGRFAQALGPSPWQRVQDFLWARTVGSSLRRVTVLALLKDRWSVDGLRSAVTWWNLWRAWRGWPDGGWLLVGVGIVGPALLFVGLRLWPPAVTTSNHLGFGWAPAIPNILTENALPVVSALWGVEAAVLALVVAIASLITTVSPSAVDAGRLMMSRYRRMAFNPAAALGLTVLALTGVEALRMSERAKADSATDSVVLVGILFGVFLGGMALLIIFSQRLISRTPEEKIKWIEVEVDRAMAAEELAQRSDERLSDLLSAAPLRAGASVFMAGSVDVDRPIRADRCWDHGPGPLQLHDMKVRQLFRWASEASDRWPSDIKQDPPFCYPVISVSLEDIESAASVVALLPRRIPGSPSEEANGLGSAFRWRTIRGPGSLYESLNELTDRAVRSARQGELDQFQLALAAVSRVYRRMRKVRTILGLGPATLRLAVALRKLLQRLGAEVLNSESASIIAAWVAFPQELLMYSRDDADRTTRAIFNIWRWVGFGAFRGTARKPELLLRHLRVRIDIYAQSLVAAMASDPESAALTEEAVELVGVCRALVPSIEPIAPGLLSAIVASVPTDDDGIRYETATFWLRYSDWLVAQYALMGSGERPAQRSGSANALREAAGSLDSDLLYDAVVSLPDAWRGDLYTSDWLTLTDEEQEREEYPMPRPGTTRVRPSWSTVALLTVYVAEDPQQHGNFNPDFLDQIMKGLDEELRIDSEQEKATRDLGPSNEPLHEKLRSVRRKGA
jgi:hypothetical protein